MNPLYALPCLLSSGFTSDSGLWPLLYYNYLHHALPLVFYSTSLLLLSYHTMSVPCLISFAVYLLGFACLCSRYGFQCMFVIRIYRYSYAYLCSPLSIQITTHRGVLSDSPGSSCPGFGAWSVWILPVADQSGAAEAWISGRPSEAPSFQAPLLGSRVFCCNSWAPCVLFIPVYPFVFSQLRLSVM